MQLFFVNIKLAFVPVPNCPCAKFVENMLHSERKFNICMKDAYIYNFKEKYYTDVFHMCAKYCNVYID